MRETLACHFDCEPEQLVFQPISGGDINRAYQLTVRGHSDVTTCFVKANSCRYRAMFDAELAALQHLASFDVCSAATIRTVLDDDSECYLLMEYLELGGAGLTIQYQFGQQLAELHRVSREGANSFGYPEDNFIGTTPQINQPQHHHWADFFIDKRLGYLVSLLQSAEINRAYQKALPRLRDYLETAEAKPALLHGDLWGGNWASCSGQPVMFDPASYYGHFEADLAMTELFGGFGADFYQGYQSVTPIPAGYQQRKTIYNTYHILNHAVLFGGGYGRQAVAMLEKVAAGL